MPRSIAFGIVSALLLAVLLASVLAYLSFTIYSPSPADLMIAKSPEGNVTMSDEDSLVLSEALTEGDDGDEYQREEDALGSTYNISAIANETSSSSSSGNVTTETVELWEPPTRENPEVVSVFNDWRWVFAEPGLSRAQFIAKRYLPHEMEGSCHYKCCVGGGYTQTTKCLGYMDLQLQYELIPPRRPLYSLVDVIRLFQRHNEPDHNLKVIMIGDSVTTQMYNFALCEALRNEEVANVVLRKDLRQAWKSDDEIPINFFESEIRLKGDAPERHTTFVRGLNYKVWQNPAALEVLLGGFDVSFDRMIPP